jgi:uncharacterized membrane protein (UPF0127 family)
VTGSRRAVWIAAGAVVLIAGIVTLIAWKSSGDGAAETRGVITNITPARAPFTGWTAGTIEVGGRKRHVVIADDSGERVQGLRGKADAAPYDGMVFVYPAPLIEPYTMATVLAPLEITFFDARGRVVDRIHMEPCKGTDTTCPTYQSRAPFQYALETADGVRYRGRLAVGGNGARMTVTPSA